MSNPSPRLSELDDDYGYERLAPRAPEPRAEPHGPPQAVQDALRAIQAHLGEVHRARDGLAERARELEGQLSSADAEIAALRKERDHLVRLKGLYERKFASIRDVMQQ